ncbi:hypothetical protein E2562_004534 [Oryza meyeriana var. granulata]|uniref:Uncharacterized protein n=1 Tax=Oryza meyeriana var. granulata TaxID=110450 RepID=A0A6G1F3F8_9ORYZ|nr:hypothetical protein E2562_004534 [Oryza meyeriana var. granulata]
MADEQEPAVAHSPSCSNVIASPLQSGPDVAVPFRRWRPTPAALSRHSSLPRHCRSSLCPSSFDPTVGNPDRPCHRHSWSCRHRPLQLALAKVTRPVRPTSLPPLIPAVAASARPYRSHRRCLRGPSQPLTAPCRTVRSRCRRRRSSSPPKKVCEDTYKSAAMEDGCIPELFSSNAGNMGNKQHHNDWIGAQPEETEDL